MSERVLAFTTRLTREDVAGVIEALVEGLKDGHLKIHKSNEALEMDVPRVIDLEVEAMLNDERATFAMEVSWRTNRAENPDRPEEYSSAGVIADNDSGAAFSENSASENAGRKKRRSGSLQKVKSAVKRMTAVNPASTKKNRVQKTQKTTAGASGTE